MAELGAEDIVDANVVCISPIVAKRIVALAVFDSSGLALWRGREYVREILNTERWFAIKVVALEEPFKQIPTHL